MCSREVARKTDFRLPRGSVTFSAAPLRTDGAGCRLFDAGILRLAGPFNSGVRGFLSVEERSGAKRREHRRALTANETTET
jgi:hypothetical protein